MRGPAVRQLAKYVLINCHNVVCSTYVLCVGRANIFEKKYLWSKEIRHKIVDFSFDGLLPLHTMGFSHLRQGLSGRGGGRHIPSQSWTGRRRRRRRRMLPFLIWWSDSALLPQNINNQFPSSLSRDGKKKGNTPGSTTTKKQYLSLFFFNKDDFWYWALNKGCSANKSCFYFTGNGGRQKNSFPLSLFFPLLSC